MNTMAIVLERPEHIAFSQLALDTPTDDDVVVDAGHLGRWHLGPAGPKETDDDPDVSMSPVELGAISLGGASVPAMVRAGRIVEHTALGLGLPLRNPGATGAANEAVSLARSENDASATNGRSQFVVRSWRGVK